MRKIKFLNVTVNHVRSAGDFVGLPESPLREIDMENVEISAETKFQNSGRRDQTNQRQGEDSSAVIFHLNLLIRGY